MSTASETAILETHDPKLLFGADKDEAAEKYKELIREYHPDKGGDPQLAAHINSLWQAYDRGMVNAITITTKRNAYKIVNANSSTDRLFNGYIATDKDDRQVYLKMARSAADNDLLANEAKMLKEVGQIRTTGGKGSDAASRLAFMTQIYQETFGFKAPGQKKALQTTAFQAEILPWYSLTRVKEQYPVLDPKDMAWMFRRILFNLGLMHELGIWHGAVTPDNIWIQPEDHGVKIVNWIVATKDEKLPAAFSTYHNFYPIRTTKDKKAGPDVDIEMAVRSIQWMLGEIPRPLRAFFNGCKYVTNAHALQEEFDELLEMMWGKRTFRPFIMPTNKKEK